MREDTKSITGISLTAWSKNRGRLRITGIVMTCSLPAAFRIAYDSLKKRYTDQSAAARYLKILYLAARDSEVAVDNALRALINENREISKEAVQRLMESDALLPDP